MFKKKHAFEASEENGKTDENLLKMLGINVKSNSKDTVTSPKVFQDIELQAKPLAKPIEPFV